MERSKKIIFVSHCILNQNARAIGKESSSGTVRELVELLADSDVGVVQLPCPQVNFNGGIGRAPGTKEAYDKKPYRSYCRKLAKEIINQIEKYLREGYNVLGILGIEFSPTCAVYQLENGKKILPGKGIFVEELEAEMRKKNFQVPIIGANLNSMFSTIEKVQALIRYA